MNISSKCTPAIRDAVGAPKHTLLCRLALAVPTFVEKKTRARDEDKTIGVVGRSRLEQGTTTTKMCSNKSWTFVRVLFVRIRRHRVQPFLPFVPTFHCALPRHRYRRAVCATCEACLVGKEIMLIGGAAGAIGPTGPSWKRDTLARPSAPWKLSSSRSMETRRTCSPQCPLDTFFVEPLSLMMNVMHSTIDFLWPFWISSMERYAKMA